MNKQNLYEKAIKEIKKKLENTEGIIPRMATIAAVLKNTIPYYFWCGFYFAEEDKLVIGPYQGTPACANITYDGVCGTSVKKKQTIIVPDVHKFSGHVVCDEKSNSEIAIPIIDKDSRTIGVFDVDSTEFNAFDEIDKKYLEKIIRILLKI
jgi:GAF domain-containing protein